MRLPVDNTLVALADPERAPVEIASSDMPMLMDRARMHGVLPIVQRKVGSQGSGDEAQERVGLMLHLRAVAARVEALASGGVRARVVKGPDFADHIYPVRADRTFTDLDILATPDAHAPLAELLLGLGYQLSRKAMLDHTEANQEQKWKHSTIPSVLVEVHGNLVHYPALRRRVSFGYDELMGCQAHSAGLGRFFTSVVHATLGHKLHQLRLLVDVLQAFRRLDSTDIAALQRSAGDMRIPLETALCLRLIGEVFAIQPAVELAGAIAPDHRLAARLIDGASVLAFPDSTLAVARHHMFRAYQYLVPRP